MTTIEEVADGLLAAGGKEYPDPVYRHEVRAFAFKGAPGTPDCETNDRPPGIHVRAWHDFRGHQGNVEFEIYGEFGGQWVKLQIYTVKMSEALEFLPRAKAVLTALWSTYCENIKGK